jgi:hypothetical protein
MLLYHSPLPLCDKLTLRLMWVLGRQISSKEDMSQRPWRRNMLAVKAFESC